jgi:hypothetical protein
MRVNIRPATLFDVPAVVDMSRSYYATTKCGRFAPFDPDSVGALAARLVDQGTLLLADAGDRLLGMIGLVVAPFTFNADVLVAYEALRWTDPANSDAGPALQRAAEDAGRARGCGGYLPADALLVKVLR